MKKKVKKLQLSRETLQVLTSSEAHKVLGASHMSCMTVFSLCLAAGTCPEKTVEPGDGWR